MSVCSYYGFKIKIKYIVYKLYNVGNRVRGTSVSSLQPPTYAGSSLTDFSTLKMEAIRASETSFYKRSIRRHIPRD
jgi:hypothetical protein